MRYLTALETQVITGTSDHEQQHAWFNSRGLPWRIRRGRLHVYREQLPVDIVAPLVAYESQGYRFAGDQNGPAKPPTINGSA